MLSLVVGGLPERTRFWSNFVLLLVNRNRRSWIHIILSLLTWPAKVERFIWWQTRAHHAGSQHFSSVSYFPCHDICDRCTVQTRNFDQQRGRNTCHYQDQRLNLCDFHPCWRCTAWSRYYREMALFQHISLKKSDTAFHISTDTTTIHSHQLILFVQLQLSTQQQDGMTRSWKTCTVSKVPDPCHCLEFPNSQQTSALITEL